MSFAQPTEVKMSPVGGSEIPIDKVPGAVSTMTAADIATTGSVIPQDFLAQRVPGITVSDMQGNGFQTDIQYRGFEASPVNGVAQGIAVYQNGVRINEAFGDIVNLDFLPEIAIHNVTVMSGNPVFGLNALGGAISFDMQDGFNYQGAEVRLSARARSAASRNSAQAGMQAATVRPTSRSKTSTTTDGANFRRPTIKRMYTDLGVKGDDSEFHINFTRRQQLLRHNSGCARRAARQGLGPDLHIAADHRQPIGNGVGQRLGRCGAEHHVIRRRVLSSFQAEHQRRQYRGVRSCATPPASSARRTGEQLGKYKRQPHTIRRRSSVRSTARHKTPTATASRCRRSTSPGCSDTRTNS